MRLTPRETYKRDKRKLETLDASLHGKPGMTMRQAGERMMLVYRINAYERTTVAIEAR